MIIDRGLREARLIRRYKRFLADVELADGSQLTLHCPNTGSMKNCQEPGCRIWYSTSDNAKRKYPHTWELIENPQGHLIGINTGRANSLVREAVEAGRVAGLTGYQQCRAEVPYGSQKSRIDLLLSGSGPDCYVEIKNVSLGVGDGLGLFPDAVTTRGHKHLQELMEVAAAGERAVLLFCVQHTGINRVGPADAIDPRYGELLREAAGRGVELMAQGASIDTASARIDLNNSLAVVLD
jgi:sugar fermentation stimulation protein A